MPLPLLTPDIANAAGWAAGNRSMRKAARQRSSSPRGLVTPLELKAARKVLGLTQNQLALALGMSGDRIVRRWESGERPVPGPAARLVRVFIEDRKVLRRYLGG